MREKQRRQRVESREYKIAAGSHLGSLEERINELAKKGYKIVGDIHMDNKLYAGIVLMERKVYKKSHPLV
jgi:hypothetical protein